MELAARADGDDLQAAYRQLCLLKTTYAQKNSRFGTTSAPVQAMIGPMDLVRLFWCAFTGLFRSKASLEAEILALRQQLNVLRRKSPKRLAFSNVDRLVFAGLYHFAPSVLNAMSIIHPEAVIQFRACLFQTVSGIGSDILRNPLVFAYFSLKRENGASDLEIVIGAATIAVPKMLITPHWTRLCAAL
jgi:hypothetical protein